MTAARRLGALLRRERIAAGFSRADLTERGGCYAGELVKRENGDHLGSPRRTVDLLRICRAGYSDIADAERLALLISRASHTGQREI